jgi:NAD(P)-dependent dehydrogenase (short-subunit alcohol dehydrogenase family)
MLMSSTEQPFDRFVGATYPELRGRRVLITGVTDTQGIDIARAFAEHGARLVVQVDADPIAVAALGEMLAPTAAELNLMECPLNGAEEVVAFARRAVAVYGGLDAVVNVVPLSLGEVADDDLDAIEARISGVLTAPCLVARVAANRMRLLQTDGLILHVATLSPRANARERAFAAAAKATLTAMTRDDARNWARDGIRVNAVAPETSAMSGAGLASEADIAALALFLAAGRGRALTGHVLEAEAA